MLIRSLGTTSEVYIVGQGMVPFTAGCASGYTTDSAGICTLYTDAQLLSGLNSIVYTSSADIPAEQLARLDPQILTQYIGSQGATVPVVPGTVLAYMLGLGSGTPSIGTVAAGSDGNSYTFEGTTWVSAAVLALNNTAQPGMIAGPSMSTTSGTTSVAAPVVSTSLLGGLSTTDLLIGAGALVVVFMVMKK